MLFITDKSHVQPFPSLTSHPFEQKIPLISSPLTAGINPMPTARNAAPCNAAAQVSLWLHSAGRFKRWPLPSFSTRLSEQSLKKQTKPPEALLSGAGARRSSFSRPSARLWQPRGAAAEHHEQAKIISRSEMILEVSVCMKKSMCLARI